MVAHLNKQKELQIFVPDVWYLLNHDLDRVSVSHFESPCLIVWRIFQYNFNDTCLK